MKKIIAFTFVLLISMGMHAQGNPSATVTATASANIIQPIEIAKISDLAFGNIVSGSADGTVIIAVDGSRTATGGVALIDAGSVSTAAIFDITGFADASFSIEVPASIIIETAGGANQMTVNNFVSNLGLDAILDENGEAKLQVGATLNVSAQQPAGMYSGTFDVIVAYN